ncbi:major facilitator superfamily transporter [Cryptosporidium xiaoi]|uniref:Major facilitator superfamily transporter n=1 Tax=Cryptosporidium xiaoi TaxID=659607 RepID=A0AAV9Y1Z8_9CRYT
MQSIKDDSKYEFDKGGGVPSCEFNIKGNCRRRKRYEKHPHAIRLVFAWLLIAQILRNYDTGAMPVLLGMITEEFGLDEMKLGILGALPYLSAMATALIMNNPLQKYSQKWIIVVSLFFLSLSLSLLLTSTSSTLLYVSRIMMGSMQAPLSIYIPVWVDEFTPPNRLTAWMGASQVTMVIGVAIGYLITGFSMEHHKNGWRFSLLLPCVMLFLMSIFLVFTKSEYFNVSYLNSETFDLELEMNNEGSTNNDKSSLTINISGGNSDSKSRNRNSFPSSCSTELIETPDSSVVITKKQGLVGCLQNSAKGGNIAFNLPSIRFDTRLSSKSTDSKGNKLNAQDEDKSPKNNVDERVDSNSNEIDSVENTATISSSASLFGTANNLTICIPRSQSQSEVNKDSINLEIEESKNDSKVSIFRGFAVVESCKGLIKNSIYILSVVLLSVIYYAVTSVQYWTTRYLQQVYSTSDGIIFMSFSATAVIAPSTGIILSGLLIDYIGGYKTKQGLFFTMLFCTASSTLATFSGILALIVDNFIVTIVGIWGLLFFGSFLVPPITGISVGVVQPNMRQFAATVTMVTYHIFGFALGSLLPGAILQITGITRPGMAIIYAFPGVGVVANLIACIVAYNKYKNSTVSDIEC